MKKNIFTEYLRSAQFRELFISEMGWNNWRGAAELPLYTVEGVDYQLLTIAERSGFQVLTCEVEQIPTPSVCRQIDTKLRRSAHDYIAIYVLKGTEHHLWVAPVRQMEKRDIVTIEYESAAKADFLFSKIDALTFDIDEQTTIVDVKERVQGAFAVNSEKITKDFYTGFRKEHNAFAQFITGIDDEIEVKKNRNKQWYTSVMLNRLMFCYFIQKKGFLDGDHDYLSHKLTWCQQERGEDRFFGTFYKGFLTHLFSDGLNVPHHEREFEQVYGKIPYLNGGMFDQHQLEHDYQDIDIRDEAFERLFAFFDKWRWHLDTRISASGRDINPDVLGYIFEQYINDRAEMGAYYTKEDITEYIGRNCILPFLFDRLRESTPEAFRNNGEVWTLLRESGDTYIFDAVKKGYTTDWRSRIPAEIACGLLRHDEDTTKPVGESNLHLLERRKLWNTPTPEPFALPTEIWRETIERLTRCESIICKIANGEITEINDFITLNLNIRQFAYDLLERTDNHLLVLHFYHALQHITILDLTCGSGAFLFAAMNILEPLYEVCISRMQEFNAANPKLFTDELAELRGRYRSNQQYFIFKSIILRNLYGVDIMQEAVEIAKLRLFLKMVAVVDADRRLPNLGLDPLPDIDFNIRCGNTLVGYATEKDVWESVTYGDMFAREEFKAKIETEMEKVSIAYDHFRTEQLAEQDDLEQVKAAKTELRQRLAQLTSLLDRQMFAAAQQSDYYHWLSTHQPFHWIAEYYSIIHDNGGFDVVIGNPPYVEYGTKLKSLYEINKSYRTYTCSNLHAYVAERSLCDISNEYSFIGLIVPLPSINTTRMLPLQNLIKKRANNVWISAFDERPSGLFNGVDQRLIIEILHKSQQLTLHTTGIHRWLSAHRDILFQQLCYVGQSEHTINLTDSVLKQSSFVEENILKKLYLNPSIAEYLSSYSTSSTVYYRTAGGRYWKVFLDKPFGTNSLSEKKANFERLTKYQTIAILSSNLFWLYYSIHFDMFNLKDYMIFGFKFKSTDSKILENLDDLGLQYIDSLEENAEDKLISSKTRGNVTQRQYYVRLSKPVIDEIDKVLARHYGFTEEELDFIINYDIKYRMGDELNKTEEE